jgi:uncharacterized ubiquitin-like protein YukD
MKLIEVNVHTDEWKEPRQIQVAEDATIAELVNIIQAEGAAIGELEEEVALLVENEEKLLKRNHKLSDHGIKHGHHVHFKRRKHEHEITVEVFAPRSTEPKRFTWPKTKLVGEAATEAAKAFGYVGGHPGFINSKRVVLDNNKSLVDAGVHNCDRLELTDTGGGV